MANLDKYTGCLLGGAVGDALGAAVEFMSLDQIRDKLGSKGVTGYLPAYGVPVAITDDTQMTLFTAEGVMRGLVRFLERGISGAEVSIVHQSYFRWLITQGELKDDGSSLASGWLISETALWHQRAPGVTCISALKAPCGLGEKAENDSKGCGTVMRVAPIGLVYQDESAYLLARQTSDLTHGHETASISAGALALLLAYLREGVELLKAIPLVIDRVKQDEAASQCQPETSSALVRAMELANRTETSSPERVETLGGGWIAEEALAISVYCALVAQNFEHGVLLAVNHSGDSDSTGAITGNILGLIHGVGAIPADWVERIELKHIIERIAIDLHDVPGRYASDDETGYSREIFSRYPGY